MKKAAKKIGIATVATLGSIILHILATACAVASIPFIAVDNMIVSVRNRFGIGPAIFDDSSYVPDLFDYMISILLYLVLSLGFLVGAIYLVHFRLSPEILLNNHPDLALFLAHDSFTRKIFEIYYNLYSSGLLYTLILIVTGIFIELSDRALSFFPALFLKKPHRLIPIEKCAVLLFNMLFIAVGFLLLNLQGISFSILSMFVGYFFWVRNDKADTDSKIKDLAKVPVLLFYAVVMVAIYAIVIFVIGGDSPELLLFTIFYLLFGMIMNLITLDTAIVTLFQIRAECKWRRKVAFEETKAFRTSLGAKIRAWLSNAKSAITEAINSMSNTIRWKYIRFRVNIRKKKRIKEKAVSRQDNDNDS